MSTTHFLVDPVSGQTVAARLWLGSQNQIEFRFYDRDGWPISVGCFDFNDSKLQIVADNTDEDGDGEPTLIPLAEI